jgi:hypothetical protein
MRKADDVAALRRENAVELPTTDHCLIEVAASLAESQDVVPRRNHVLREV